MDNLLSILQSETQELKELFLNQTKTWAEKNFQSCEMRNAWKAKEWCEYLGLVPIVNDDFGHERWDYPTNFHNTTKARELRNAKNYVYQTLRYGQEQYLATELTKAIQHYETSIIKLANRITAKGLVFQNLAVTKSNIGVNINLSLTDGTKTVKAWTIIAEGAIQKPHYRYLVK